MLEPEKVEEEAIRQAIIAEAFPKPVLEEPELTLMMLPMEPTVEEWIRE